MRITLAALALLLLAGCAGAPKPRMFAPSATVQEIRVSGDGRWVVALRVQNNARLGIRVDAIEARLSIDGSDAGRLDGTSSLPIASSSAERVEFTLTPTAAAASTVAAALEGARGVSYVIEGVLRTSEPERRKDPFRFESRLNPAPGLAGTLR